MNNSNKFVKNSTYCMYDKKVMDLLLKYPEIRYFLVYILSFVTATMVDVFTFTASFKYYGAFLFLNGFLA